MEKDKVIKNFKIKYDGTVYDNITHFSISTYGGDRVSFTSISGNTTSITVNCKLDEIEIIRE